MKNFFFKLAKINSSNFSIMKQKNQKRGSYGTPQRRARRNRLETGIRSVSAKRKNKFVHSPCESPRQLPFGGIKILKDPESKTVVKCCNFVTDQRNQERLKILKNKVEIYRMFIESFELPSKMNRRLLLNSSKNKIRNPKNFQYSLGIPKKVIFDKTSVNINGLKGDIHKLKENKNLGKFVTNDKLKVFPLYIPSKPFYICQNTCLKKNCCEKKMVEIGLFATSEITESNLTLVNYSTRKMLINGKFKFKDDYRCKKNGLYSNINFNVPLLHVFDSDEIKILNYHRSVKFGGKRLINKVDLVKRKLIPCREIKHRFDPKEKLEDFIRLPSTKFYFFLKFERENKVFLYFYDFEKDERIVIGNIKTTGGIRDGNKNNCFVINPEHLGCLEKGKIQYFVEKFKPEFQDFPEDFDRDDVIAIIDINFLLNYKESQNFLCFVTKELKAYCLDVSPLVLLDKRFDDVINFSGIFKQAVCY